MGEQGARALRVPRLLFRRGRPAGPRRGVLTSGGEPLPYLRHMPRVLLLSGGTGAGHRMTATAVAEELSAVGLTVTHRDAYDCVSGTARWAYTQLHLGLLEFVPEFYGPLYERGSNSRLLARVQTVLTGRSRARFAQVLEAVRPDVVCATHALGCTLAAPLKEYYRYALVLVTTDYRAHAFQVHHAVDRYCVSHAWAMADLRAAGIPAERLTVTGIPLRPQFDRVPSSAAARASLGLPADRPVVLVTRGGMAAGPETVTLLEALLAAPALRQAQCIAVLGSRERSARLVARRVPVTSRLRVERFTPCMDLFLAAADVVVGKAGGLSSTEVFTVGRPLVIYAPNEGIETANVARFVSAGAALDAGRSPAAAVAAVTTLLADPAQGEALVAGARRLLTPASRQAVGAVLRELAGVPVPAPAGTSARRGSRE